MQVATREKKEIIIVKVGTSTLSSHNAHHGIDIEIIEKLSNIIAKLIRLGHKVILVTSGAVALGVKKLKLSKKPNTILGKQLAAAVGQAQLMQVYDKYFSKNKLIIAQILLTRDDFAQRKVYVNAKETILELLSMNVIPIINENDAIANEEIKFGDNDMLSAMLSELIDADRLIILTDEEGLYDKNPKKHRGAKLISLVRKMTLKIEKMASGTDGELGSGGMTTKLRAAKLVTSLGTKVHIIYGKRPEKIFNLLKGEYLGTTFLPI